MAGFGIGQSSVDTDVRYRQLGLQNKSLEMQDRRAREDAAFRKQQADGADARDKRDFNEGQRRFDAGLDRDARDFAEGRRRFDAGLDRDARDFAEGRRRFDTETARRDVLDDRAFERQLRMDGAALHSMTFQDALNEQKFHENNEQFEALRRQREEDDRQMEERRKVSQGTVANVLRYFLTSPDFGKNGQFLSPSQLAAVRKASPEFAGLLGIFAGEGEDGRFQVQFDFGQDEQGNRQVVPYGDEQIHMAMSTVYGRAFADSVMGRGGRGRGGPPSADELSGMRADKIAYDMLKSDFDFAGKRMEEYEDGTRQKFEADGKTPTKGYERDLKIHDSIYDRLMSRHADTPGVSAPDDGGGLIKADGTITIGGQVFRKGDTVERKGGGLVTWDGKKWNPTDKPVSKATREMELKNLRDEERRLEGIFKSKGLSQQEMARLEKIRARKKQVLE